MTEHRTVDRLPVSSDRALPGVAALAMVGWVLFELAFRKGLAPALADPLGSTLGADMLSLLVALPLSAAVIARLGRTVGVDRSDWGYTASARAVGVGLLGAVVFLVLARGITLAVVWAFDLQSSAAAVGPTPQPATWVVVAFLGVNGLAVPVAEELAWRGVIQTALTDAYGVALGVALTAAAFVLKHLVVDAPALIGAAPTVVVSRVVALVVLASVLGVLRARYGTTSSTVAHVGMNLAASATLLAA